MTQKSARLLAARPPARSASSSTDWSPGDYLQFEDERTRPARDLLAHVTLVAPQKVVDVGCGPGNSTALLAARYSQADILGIDNSAAMLAEARARLPGLRFESADANVWVPEADVDLVFSNATYHWIAAHIERLERVVAALSPGAVLAVQMPDNLAEPIHRLMQEVARAGPWTERLKGAARAPLPPAEVYFERLRPLASNVEIWRTTYLHQLADASAIVEFVRSTGLRPFLDLLSEAERKDFLAQFLAEIARAYPPTAADTVLLPFPRLFFVVRR